MLKLKRGLHSVVIFAMEPMVRQMSIITYDAIMPMLMIYYIILNKVKVNIGKIETISLGTLSS